MDPKQKTRTIMVYTQNGAISFELAWPCDDFGTKLAEALDQGTVMCDTADGSKLILNAINVVAVEICADETAEIK